MAETAHYPRRFVDRFPIRLRPPPPVTAPLQNAREEAQARKESGIHELWKESRCALAMVTMLNSSIASTDWRNVSKKFNFIDMFRCRFLCTLRTGIRKSMKRA